MVETYWYVDLKYASMLVCVFKKAVLYFIEVFSNVLTLFF